MAHFIQLRLRQEKRCITRPHTTCRNLNGNSFEENCWLRNSLAAIVVDNVTRQSTLFAVVLYYNIIDLPSANNSEHFSLGDVIDVVGLFK